MRRIAITAFSTVLLGCGGENPSAPKPANLVTVTIVNPTGSIPLATKAESICTVRVQAPEGTELPQMVFADFSRGKVSAGQFQSNPATFKDDATGGKLCDVKIQAPPAPGKYTLNASVHWLRSKPDDPAASVTIDVN